MYNIRLYVRARVRHVLKNVRLAVASDFADDPQRRARQVNNIKFVDAVATAAAATDPFIIKHA